jgi:peptide/nickel transport system substrate-binding protein
MLDGSNAAAVRRAIAALIFVTVALFVAGCGGGGTAAAGGSDGILKVGSTYNIDSLNPFVAFDAQAYNAFTMEYPQLVQYGPGLKLEGDWAKSWTTSSNGLVWTFHLIPGGKWSDGKPLTAQDAVWTIETELKYKAGAASFLAGTLLGVSKAEAPDANTLVITYSHPIAGVLANLEQVYILPQHVWSKYTGNDGHDLKSFFPEQNLPTVSGGAYMITKFDKTGTTVFKPNPYFYGPKSHAAAVAFTYYTNPTSMIADFQRGNLDFIDQVPYTVAKTLKGNAGTTVVSEPGSEVTNLGFNSNPKKPQNRELLNTTLKEAFEYAIPRQQLIDVVFGGEAVPWANIMSAWSGPSGFLNPAVKPLPYDVAKANQLLDGLGYARGSDGIREVPATTGQYAQAAHEMSYSVIVPGDLDFSGDRQFEILQTAFAKIGVKINEIPGGDVSAAYTLITNAGYKYTKADMFTWYWHPYIDPNFNLSVVTKAQWGNNSDTGMDDPKYDAWYKQEQVTVNPQARQKLVWKMEAYLADNQRPYIQLVNTNLITAHDQAWTGFYPQLWSYCKCYYTSPHTTS